MEGDIKRVRDRGPLLHRSLRHVFQQHIDEEEEEVVGGSSLPAKAVVEACPVLSPVGMQAGVPDERRMAQEVGGGGGKEEARPDTDGKGAADPRTLRSLCETSPGVSRSSPESRGIPPENGGVPLESGGNPPETSGVPQLFRERSAERVDATSAEVRDADCPRSFGAVYTL
jgi:hypothetical protein